MTITISKGVWGEELVIISNQKSAKVFISGNELKIEGDEFLKEIGMKVSDALALFFDQAASQQTKARFPNYLGHRGG